MGADTFINLQVAPDAKTAFRVLTENARYRYGHDGYTGSVAEKDSFTMIDTVETQTEAIELANRLVDEEDPRVDDKWGPAGCIEIKSKGAFLFFGWASS